jgi:uncharacterized protein involved in exopolysaccharide biosynthesis
MMAEDRSFVTQGGLDFWLFLRVLWSGRWVVVILTVVFVVGGAIYAFVGTQLFKAEVVMIQADDNKSMSAGLAQLGGLASLAGINIGTGGQTGASVAVLRSKELAREFITNKGLIKVLFADKLDSRTGDWKRDLGDKTPEIRDAVEYFQKKIYSVTEDKKAGTITLSITWRDPQVSANWGNDFVQMANAKIRDRAVEEAARHISYLKDEMVATNVTSLQQAVGRVLESEMQKMMLARGNDEYAFKVVDRATPPKRRVWPPRLFLLIGSAIAGFLTSVVLLMARNEWRFHRSAGAQRAVG